MSSMHKTVLVGFLKKMRDPFTVCLNLILIVRHVLIDQLIEHNKCSRLLNKLVHRYSEKAQIMQELSRTNIFR